MFSIEFLGIWEEMYNQEFNFPEFEGIKNEAGFNRFVLSVKQWIENKKTSIYLLINNYNLLSFKVINVDF